MTEPVAVKLARGPIHLAFPISEARLGSVCGRRFGHASVVPTWTWRLALPSQRCTECAEAAAHARSSRILRKIAGL